MPKTKTVADYQIQKIRDKERDNLNLEILDVTLTLKIYHDRLDLTTDQEMIEFYTQEINKFEEVKRFFEDKLTALDE